METTQATLFRFERWSEYWCLLLNQGKFKDAFFSVDPHQANLQPHLLLFNFRLRFYPTPTFLWVTFDRTFSLSKHVSLLKAKFSFVSRPYAASLLPQGAPLKSFSLFYMKVFFGPFSLMHHPDVSLPSAY